MLLNAEDQMVFSFPVEIWIPQTAVTVPELHRNLESGILFHAWTEMVNDRFPIPNSNSKFGPSCPLDAKQFIPSADISENFDFTEIFIIFVYFSFFISEYFILFLYPSSGNKKL